MTTDKTLASKAVSIQGKKYVLVSDRIIYFNEHCPEGSISTELLTAVDSQTIVIRATVKPDHTSRTFTGHSQAVIGQGYINKTAALENAETSAVGRALAMLGIGVIDSVASVDEIHKATATMPRSAPARSTVPVESPTRPDQGNVDDAIAEAFPDSVEVAPARSATPPAGTNPQLAQCVKCNKTVAQVVEKFSRHQFGIVACRTCQAGLPKVSSL